MGKGKERPIFPKRAVITAGMPYGNKELHFGHVGGMFVHADTFARFMRDRIGRENVLFVCGTDCYGSPALESYRKLRESGELGEDVTIQDRQRQTKTGWNVCQLSNIIFTVHERYGGSIWSDSIAIESARGLLPYKTRTYFYLFWL